jgi:HD-GYP domain-containing protein (c-di-GMP phosphodiesterase class II)
MGKKSGEKLKKKTKVIPFPGNTAPASAPTEPALECLRSIIVSLEEKDSYTYGHSIRLAEFAVMLATEMGLSEEEIREAELSALLHDVGKIGIPDSVLLKPARLTRAEFEIMKTHPVRSARIVQNISSLQHLLPGIRHHHERWDGLGYPDGLKGEEIPLYARLILVVDTFDAMTSTRPYRLALDKEVAIAELKRCAGTQFDSRLVEHFIRALRKQDQGVKVSVPMSVLKKIA